MTFANQLRDWNAWYDGVPKDKRFQALLGPLLAIGAINFVLTIMIGFPFGLLIVLAIIAMFLVRQTANMGWIKADEASGHASIEIQKADWLHDLNLKYEAMPEQKRFWILPVVLIVAGMLNMFLSIDFGFPFGLLFLIALLVMVALRAPFVHGMVPAPASKTALSAPDTHPMVAHEPMPALAPPAPPIHEPAFTPIHEPAFTSEHEPAFTPEPAPLLDSEAPPHVEAPQMMEAPHAEPPEHGSAEPPAH